MSGDDPETPPDEDATLEAKPDFEAMFQAAIDEALEETYGPARPRPRTPSNWPALSNRISDQAVRHRINPDKALEQIDRFDALATIGEGGFGLVIKAYDPKLERLVALKLCPARGPGAEQALLEEAQALAKIKHPNIITVHEVGEYGDAFFLVTEYVDGMDMYDFAVDCPLKWEAVVGLFLAVGEALAAAHDSGVVHGDVKPANILVEKQTWVPYLVDFGLARIMGPTPEQLEGERSGVGTLDFMAPELLRGGVRDALSDQYAFCVSLWQSIEGNLPYIGGSRQGLLSEIEGAQPLHVRSDVPARVRDVIRRGLSADPADRYPDMKALVRELALARGPALLDETSVDSGPEGVPLSPDDGPKSPPRLVVKKGLVFGLALMLTGAGVLRELYMHRAGTQLEPTELAERQLSPRELAEGEFLEARALLESGDARGSHQKWVSAKAHMEDVDPLRGAEMSLELSRSFGEHLDCDSRNPTAATRGDEDELCAGLLIIAGWMAEDAAESLDSHALWRAATEAREHAAAMYTAAGDKGASEAQLECVALNRAAKSCEE